MSAIREAIAMSQEASDHTCLQHVLYMMYRTVDIEEKQRLMEKYFWQMQGVVPLLPVQSWYPGILAAHGGFRQQARGSAGVARQE